VLRHEIVHFPAPRDKNCSATVSLKQHEIPSLFGVGHGAHHRGHYGDDGDRRDDGAELLLKIIA
jgi:hypothetical protein